MSIYRGKDRTQFYLASLLYDSIEYKHFDSVKSLLTEKAADPNIVLPKKGISPFHLIIGCEHYEFCVKVTSLILQYGGNPNVRSDDGLTPVHIAAAWGRTELLNLLLSCGGDPEVRDINYKTPFYYAAEEGFLDCLELLKSYLPVKNDLIKREEEDDVGCLVLDKIFINNGSIIGEYEVENKESNNSIIKKHNDLQSLPQTDTTEYILNWFNKQHSSTNSNASEHLSKSVESTTSYECSDSSFGESDDDRQRKRFDPRLITFRKVYKKTRKISNCSSKSNCSDSRDITIYQDANSDQKQKFNDTIYVDAEEFTHLKEYSKESGIVTLSNSIKDLDTFGMEYGKNLSQTAPSKQEKSSDYLTCSHNSINTFEKNIFDITDNLSLNIKSDKVNIVLCEKENSIESKDISEKSNELSFVSVSEVYKYVDKDEGVVLYERRLLKTSSEYAKSVKSSVPSSKLSSLPETIDYDTDTLKRELTVLGYNPGPITLTTKRVYLKKLHQLKKYPALLKNDEKQQQKKVYSLELQKTLHNPDWCNDIATYRSLEEVLIQQFASPDPTRKWREGVNKSSFTYLLLDPRITSNLPFRADSLQGKEVWETFLSAIFYVGKGKRSRPYQHLYDAVELWKKEQFETSNKKLQNIIDIWKNGAGVICLHIFLNVIPVEAYTREAAMISAINLDNLTNIKSGEFYGVPATWPQKKKKMLGAYLLYKAMMIFLHEGERQLCPTDIE